MFLILIHERHPCGFQFRSQPEACVYQALNEDGQELMGIFLSFVRKEEAGPHLGEPEQNWAGLSPLFAFNELEVRFQ